MWQSEDWSNDAENSASITEINYIFKYFQIEMVILICYIISKLYCIFD